MVKGYWKGKFHTRCRFATGRPSSIPLLMFNLLWWNGRVCLDCVPGPILPKSKVAPWPFALDRTT